MSRRRRMSEADGRLADVLEGHCSLLSLCHHCSSGRVKVILLNKQGILITDAEKKRRREEDDDRRQSDLASSSAVAAATPLETGRSYSANSCLA